MLILDADSLDTYTAALTEHSRLLVDYYKDLCPGCKMLELALTRFAAMPMANDVVLLKVKMEIFGEDFFRSLGLRQTPTLVLFKDGNEISRLPGYQTPAQIEQAIASNFF